MAWENYLLEECPFCGYEFDPDEERAGHFRREHGPEVIG